jgi:FkbM family methyltransferase
LSHFPEGYVGYVLDIGASDGVSINSTYVLEKQYRWTILSIEANPFFAESLNKHRAFFKVCACSDKPSDSAEFHVHLDNLEAFSSLKPGNHKKFVEEAGDRWATIRVPVWTVDNLLEQAEFPRLDALCIDTEGTERDVLRGCDLKRWNPKVILVECWDRGGLDDILVPLGYERIWRSVDNDGYVRNQAS